MGQERANARHFFGIAAEQHLYNLLTRYAELEVLPAAMKQGIAIMTYSPLSGGRLTRAGFASMQEADAAGKLDEAAKALEVKLTAENLKQLDEIFPAMGAAPEAYAW